MSEKKKNNIEELLKYGFAKAYLLVLSATVSLFNIIGLLAILITAWWQKIK